MDASNSRYHYNSLHGPKEANGRGSSNSRVSRITMEHQQQQHRKQETREGWSLPTVESEMNGDSNTNERGPSVVSSFGLL